MSKNWEEIAHKAQTELHMLKSKEPEYRLNRLRDEFAMSALTGLVTSTDQEGTWTYGNAENVAKESYSIADQMLKARIKS